MIVHLSARRWRRTLAVALIAVTGAAPIVLAQTAPAPAPAPAPGAAAPDAKTFPQEKLDQLLAPIALYPDPLIAHVLMASTYPLEVVQAERWVKANPSLKDKALEDALQKQPWDPAVKSLTKFPQVLTMMSEKLDWTQELGDAFLAQKEDVAKTVQNLRAKAQAQGNLKDTKEQKVVTEAAGTTTVIKIEPANPQVVYVPTYNPTVVYGSWWYPSYPPYYYYPPGYVAGGALLGFTAGVIVGGALWGNMNWGGGDVDIDINRSNEFNRTNNSNKSFKHDASHRGAVPYKDKAVAAQNNRAGSAGAAQRDAYRGREGGAQAGTMDRGAGQAGAGNRAGSAQAGTMDRGSGASAGSMDRGGSADFGRGADSVSNRAGSGAGAADRSSAGSSYGGSRNATGTSGGGAFNTGSRAQTQSASNRGASSMQSSRGGGGGGASRGGGGGGRGGGGRR